MLNRWHQLLRSTIKKRHLLRGYGIFLDIHRPNLFDSRNALIGSSADFMEFFFSSRNFFLSTELWQRNYLRLFLKSYCVFQITRINKERKLWDTYKSVNRPFIFSFQLKFKEKFCKWVAIKLHWKFYISFIHF